MDDLRERVAAAYDRLDLPSWPNPRPDGSPARDEQYSRVTEPARYRIVHARSQAWTAALGGLPGVTVEPLPEGGSRIASDRAGTLPLLLVERTVPLDGQDGSIAVLDLSVAEPRVAMLTLPDCGCDACDYGSQDLLDATDETILHVVRGPFVVLAGPDWQVVWHVDGGSSSHNAPDHRRLMDLCERLARGERVDLPPRTEAFVGRSWLD